MRSKLAVLILTLLTLGQSVCAQPAPAPSPDDLRGPWLLMVIRYKADGVTPRGAVALQFPNKAACEAHRALMMQNVTQQEPTGACQPGFTPSTN